eukprot:COSAG02_NODE_10043_length_2039_cov_1.460825_2_plen_64_part_00
MISYDACVPVIDAEVMEIVPDNIENDTHFLRSRPAQSEAKLAMDNIKKKAVEEKAAQERGARK